MKLCIHIHTLLLPPPPPPPPHGFARYERGEDLFLKFLKTARNNQIIEVGNWPSLNSQPNVFFPL